EVGVRLRPHEAGQNDLPLQEQSGSLKNLCGLDVRIRHDDLLGLVGPLGSVADRADGSDTAGDRLDDLANVGFGSLGGLATATPGFDRLWGGGGACCGGGV